MQGTRTGLPTGSGNSLRDSGSQSTPTVRQDGTMRHSELRLAAGTIDAYVTTLPSLNEVALASMTLIDESTKHLSEQMRSLTGSEAAEIQGACAIVKNIRELIKLKMDIAKGVLK